MDLVRYRASSNARLDGLEGIREVPYADAMDDASFRRVLQEPFHGVAMNYTFDDQSAADRHETQYFELGCNRGIYHKGWTAVTRHGVPWIVTGSPAPVDDDGVWELYDTATDWTQAHDLAAEMPDKLEYLKRLFETEAAKYNVFSLPPVSRSRW